MKKTLLTSFVMCFSLFVFAQSESRHIQAAFEISDQTFSSPLNRQYIWAESFMVLNLNHDAMNSELNGSDIPHRNELNPQAHVVLSLPNPDGGSDLYKVFRNTTMHPNLQQAFPEIRTYDVVGLSNRLLKGKIDITPHGFHAMIFDKVNGTFFIDPVQQQNNELYMVYYKKHFVTNKTMSCSHDHNEHSIAQDIIENGDIVEQLSYASCELRTYRLAIAATGEYTTFHGGTVALALAAQVTSINRVNGVYEKEIGITMQIIPNNELIIYTNPLTDPYSNNNGSAMLNENQNNLTTVIGGANYDIGHVYSTGGGGIANLGSVCSNTGKARGVSGNPSPIGDPFDIDYVCHEIGHQFGAEHTQNNSCNRNNATAMEPGSASTILGYAGICSPNVQNNSDAYFHAISLQEIGSFISGPGGSCAVITNIANQAPVISATNGGITIPVSTPFALTATASDPDGDNIFYRWEQMNNQVSTQPPVATSTGGPNFRSFEGTNNPTRYFPRLEALVNNGPFTWERLPSVSRTMNFRVTAHDDHVVGGCSDYVNTTVTFDATAGPFVLTYPSATGISWQIATTETVTWNVANTTNANVNCQLVNIYLSTDGGLNYPHVLATNVPNNGSANVSVPNLPTNTARVMVRAANGTFFDISDYNFSISNSVCNTYNATNVPVNIPASGTPTVTSTMNITQAGTITNVDVLNLIGTHTWVSDLTISVTSPQGTVVQLFTNICGSQDNFNLNFSDAGAATPIPCPPTTGLTYQPTGSLANFIGEDMQGVWTLTVSDAFNEDGGALQSWGLNICYDVDGYLLVAQNPTASVCAGNNANYTIDVNQLGAYTDPVTLSVSGLPVGASASWSTNPVSPGNNSALAISTTGVATGNYSFTVNANSTAGAQSTNLNLNVTNIPPLVFLSSPADNATNLPVQSLNFTWQASTEPNATYTIDIASNSNFSNIVESQSNIAGTTYTATTLTGNQSYFWRVRASNTCGNSPYSAVRTFTTESCNLFNATNVPINIPASGTPTVTSTMNITQAGTITNVDVLNLIGTHTWVSDLTISVTSPQGTVVQLFTNICGSQDNFNLNFSDAGAATPIPCPPTTGLTYQPSGSLANFIGEDMQGVWTLTVADAFNEDGGALQSWSLNICFEPDPCPSPSVAPTSIDLAGVPFCMGGELTLSTVGGSLAPGAQWEWFSGSCGGAALGTGNSVQVSPSSNTNYFVRASQGTGCPESSCTQLNFEVPSVGNSLSIDGDAATCVVNSGDWVHFYNANGRLIASVNSNGQDLGEVNASSFVNSDPYILGACDDPTNNSFLNAVLARSFIITPDVQPSNPVAVRLYISEAEFLAYQTAAQNTTGNPFDNVNTIADMHLTKHFSAQQQGLPSDICAGGSSSFILQNASGNTSSIFAAIGSSYYLEYVIDGFSQFFPMNANNSSLPVSLTSFEAICQAFNIELNWATASEQNASHFRIESSRDGSTWLLLGEVEAGGNSSQALSYQFVDQKINNTNLYYRLVQVDLDGSETSYPPVQVSCEENQNSAEVFPNPNNGSFHLAIQSASNFGKRTIAISDLTGKIVHSLEINLESGAYLIPFEHLKLAQGAYILQIPGLEDQFKPLRIVVGP